jgi:RHS repeat-associated protein
MMARSAPKPAANAARLLADHLGSTTVTVGADGEPVGQLRYRAFGATRFASGEPATDYRYTGQRELSEIGLYYYRARWYDAALGRFVQPDTLIPDAGRPQAWDRYAYVGNNPVRFSDPTGHRDCGARCPDDMSLEPNLDQYQGRWDLREQRRNTRVVKTILTTVVESFFGTLVPAADAAIALRDGPQWYDTFALLPIVTSSFADDIGRGTTRALRQLVPEDLGLRAFSANNTRRALQLLTGAADEAITFLEAHHVLPVKFIEDFLGLGDGLLNIHDPRFLSWVDETAHRAWSAAYNSEWAEFFRDQPMPSVDDVLTRAGELARRYGFEINWLP